MSRIIVNQIDNEMEMLDTMIQKTVQLYFDSNNDAEINFLKNKLEALVAIYAQNVEHMALITATKH